MSFLVHCLRPGDLFFDVGANVGAYTVLASAAARREPPPARGPAVRRYSTTRLRVTERVSPGAPACTVSV
jgi:predicted RNA methylase